MSEDPDDWTPQLDPKIGGLQFKWGHNGETEALTIWEVGGPGDGFPSHNTYLTTAWGRPVRHGQDIIGTVLVEETTVRIVVYGDVSPPASVTSWVETNLPRSTIQVSRDS